MPNGSWSRAGKKIVIGLDTGFFVELLKGNAAAIGKWKGAVEGETDAVVSGLSIYELRRLALKGGLAAGDVQTAIDAILAVCKVAWIDHCDLLYAAVGLAHGLDLPATDALILASLIQGGADDIYTTDRHMEKFKKKGICIHNLNR